MKHILPLVAALLFAISLPARAQSANTQVTPSPSARDFVNQAEMIDLFEIAAGETAESKKIPPAYKDYARMTVRDHKQMQAALQGIVARMKSVSGPGALDADHDKMLKHLQALDGAPFEQHYRSGQIAGHQKAINLFQNYGRTGDAPQIKRWSADAVPMLQKHLDAAKRLSPPTVHAAQ